MSDLAITGLLVLSLFLILGSGVWIGLTLSGVAWIAMQLFSARPAGDAMAVTIWGSASSWTLTALPLFIWMGEILFRTRLSQDMFKGLAPWVQALPGRLLHTNVVGCTIFAAVSGSSAATCATIGKMTLPELTRRGYPEHMVVGTLAGASTLGLLIPPSIIMIVYGVSAEVSISQLFIAGVLPGILLAALFSGYIMLWALRHPEQVPAADVRMSFMQKLSESRSLIPVVLLIAGVLGSIYTGFATATEAAAVGVVGSLALSAVQGSMTWGTFKDSLMGATRLYCMIALILAGAAFLTLSMGYIGLPRHLAEWITGLGLNQAQLIAALAVFFIVLGCFLDGISMVVLTMGVLMPTVQAAGIDRDTHVIVVHAGADHTDFGAAARVYWTLKVGGLSRLSILDGGTKAWQAAGGALESAVPQVTPTRFVYRYDQEQIVTSDELAAALQSGNTPLLVDARPARFFSGEARVDAAARYGTLPGAKSFDNAQFFPKGGTTLKPASELKALVALSGADAAPAVSFCNTGHWAATNWFVMSEIAGNKSVKLYPASVVEWSQSERAMENQPSRVTALVQDVKRAFDK